MSQHFDPRTPAPGSAPPLAELAMIGDGRSAALLSSEGNVVFWCPWRFDGDSAFLSLLDPDGGTFATRPDASHRAESGYLDGTNVHRSRIRCPHGTLIVTTALEHTESRKSDDQRRLFRLLECQGGPVDVTLEFSPRFRYGSLTPPLLFDERRVVAEGPEGSLTLDFSLDLPRQDGTCRTTFTMGPGDREAFVIEGPQPSKTGTGDAVADAEAGLDEQAAFWRRWLSQMEYDGYQADQVRRSLLALKLLQYTDSGAFIAAPTFGLPQRPGGPENWDYRYVWLRDSAFIVMAFETLGFEEESLAYRRWLARLVKRHEPEELAPLYRVDGEPAPQEKELSLKGYLDSRPVHVGNHAVDQQQLDSYGNIMICFHRADQIWREEGDSLWQRLSKIADSAMNNWTSKDSGIWERPTKDHWTYSKGMAWLALSRAREIGEKYGYLTRPSWKVAEQEVEKWLEGPAVARDGSFIQSQSEPVAESAALLFPLFGIIKPEDPRVVATLDAVDRDLVSHGLAYRYLLDSKKGMEGAFLAVNFWIAEDLANLGRPEAARRMFEAPLGVSPVFGLLPEQAAPVSRTGIGNHPLGLSHYSLVLSAYAIDKAGRGREEEGLPAQSHGFFGGHHGE